MFTNHIDTTSYADDTTSYVNEEILDSTVKPLVKQEICYQHGLIITKWKETKINVM